MIIVEPWMAVVWAVIPIIILGALILTVRDQIMKQQVEIYEWLTNEVKDEDAS